MAIFLGGGDGAAESIQLDRTLAAAVRDGKVVYWPFGMADDPEFATCEVWLRRAFEELDSSPNDERHRLTGRLERALT